MADVLFYKIQFLANNPYGEFVTGDVVDIYYNVDNEITPDQTVSTSITAITVKKNGVTITSGASIFSFETGYKTSEYVQLNICIGTVKSSPIPSLFGAFPYSYAYFEFNHPACETVPTICDLFVTGIPQVVQPTQLNPLGSFTVSASSSNPIQYKLGYDFSYNDGSGHQATGAFTDLVPGTYKVYIRDSKNCGTNISITILQGQFYNPVYRLEYDTQSGSESKVDIVKLSYGGSVTEICGADVAFSKSLRGEGSQDKFETILSTTATLELTSETDFQFLNIYTNNPEEYRINYYIDSVLKGVYKVLPQQYEEDYKAPPYYLTVVSTDGLAELREFPFLRDDGFPFEGKIKAIEAIAICLKRTGLRLNIRCGINMYAVGMTTTASSDPIDQAYIDPEAIYSSTDNPTVRYALDHILRPFCARLVQENSVWNIVRVEELRGSYDYREFDPDGVYVSNSSNNPIVSIVNPSSASGVYWSDQNQYMTLCPGYGKIIVKYFLGLKDNILKNGNFRLKPVISLLGNSYVFDIDKFGWQLINGGYSVSETYEAIGESNVAYKITGGEDTNGEAFLLSDTYSVKMGALNTLKIQVTYKIPPPFGISTRPGITGPSIAPIEVNIPYQKVRISVSYGSKYLRSDGNWDAAENKIIFFETKFSEYVTQEIIARQPDEGAVDGYDFKIRVYHSYIYHYDHANITSLKAQDTVDLPVGTRTQMLGTYGGEDAIYYYKLDQSTEAESNPLTVRPDDYHATDNPVIWRYESIVIITYFDDFQTPFWVDKVSVEMLSNGTKPTDVIIRETNAETRNKYYMEKDLIFGSYSNLITTLSGTKYFGQKSYLYLGATAFFNYGPTPQPVTVTTDVLSADLLYTGYFRDSNDVGYERWTRDGQSEQDSVHSIFLKQHAAQYKKSWRKITGSVYSDVRNFSFLDVFRETHDGDRLYLPISGTIEDKNNRFNGEFLELIDITQPGQSTSAFTRGFKQSGYR